MIFFQRLTLISSAITIPPAVIILLYHYHQFLTGLMEFFGVEPFYSPVLATAAIVLPLLFFAYLIIRYLDE